MKRTLSLGGLAAANLFVLILIQWYVVTRLGVGVATDALFAGMAVPQLVLAVVSGSLTHVLVPLLSSEEETAFGEVAWGFFLAISGLFAVLAVLLSVTASIWVAWLLPGFAAPARALTADLTRIQLLGMVFTASLSVLWSAYHARSRFIWPELSSLIAGVVSFLLLIPALHRFGVAAAAWATVLRSALPVFFLLPGLGPWRKPRWGSAPMISAWRRLRPLLIGTAYYKTDPVVDRLLSSMAPAGGLSLLYIGQQIWGAVALIINKAVATPMVPLLAAQAKARLWTDFEQTYRKRLLWMLGLTGVGFALFLALGEPALRLAIGHGGVTRENVASLWRIMVALGGVLIGGCAGQVTSAAFYAIGDTRTPTRLGIVTYTVFVPAKVLAFFRWGLIGVAVATSLYFLVNLSLQMFRWNAGKTSRAVAVHEAE